jgi:hypothetical protein
LRRVRRLRCLGVQLVLRFQCRRALSLHRLTWPRQHPLGSGQPPVSGRLFGTDGGVAARPMSRFPDAFRPPAFASWPSCSRRGFGLPHGRPTGQQRCRISTGFPRSTRARNDRGGRPLYPGNGGVLPVEGSLFNRHLLLSSGQSLHPADTSHRRDPNVTRHHRRFTRVHPSGLPLPVTPGWDEGPWASSLSFAPRRCRRRTSGRGQAMDTGPELHLRHQSNLQSMRPLISCDLVSHRAGVPGRPVLCAAPPGHLTLSAALPASPTADSSDVSYRHWSFMDTGLHSAVSSCEDSSGHHRRS